MNAFLGAATLFALFALLVARNVVIVPPGYAYVVERLGRYRSTLGAGWSLLTPFVDRIAFRLRVDGETVALTGPVAATIELRVTDPRKACYDVADFREAVARLARRLAEEEMARRGRPESDSAREILAAELAAGLAAPLGAWGLELRRVNVIKP